MKNISLALALFLAGWVQAQFNIQGEISNYSEQAVLVRIFNGASDKLINKVKTDAKGKFDVKIPENYRGIVRLTNANQQAVIDILTDNESVKFKAIYSEGQFKDVDFTEGKTAKGFKEYREFEGFRDLKTSIFPMLKSIYDTNDDFYKAIVKEEERIEKINPADQSPLLSYFSEISALTNSRIENPAAAEMHKTAILNRLVNDSDLLEGSGLFSQLVLDYMRSSTIGANSQQEINTRVDRDIQYLLDQTDIETPRGQNVLSAVFSVLPQEQFGGILEKYYQLANNLTCEITDDLKTRLAAHNIMEPGSTVPNIVFKEPVKGIQSLYDIKADKKLVIFWASWCPACQREMPFVEEYYKNFKAEGGEILSISLDYDEADFTAATKNHQWITYTELLQWDTTGVEEFGVTGTPTLFLLDKDNKLIKRASHISELVNL